MLPQMGDGERPIDGSGTMLASGDLQAFRQLLGPAGMIEDPSRIAPYIVDQRNLLQGETPAILRPVSTEQVVDLVRLAARLGFGIVPQGGNTSYCGGATPDRSGRQLVLSLERMTRIREVDVLSMCISVDAGAILKDVQDAAAAAGLLLPLSLGAEGSCRIGGNIGTNAGGLSVLRYGMTRDLMLGIEAVLPDGSVVSDMRKLKKNNTGYDVKQCFIGSEGTLGIVTGAVLKLFPATVQRATAWIELASDVPLSELLSTVRRESCDLVTSFEFITERSITLTTSLGPDQSRLKAGSGGAVLIELSASSQRLDLSDFMEGILGEVMERGWVEDAFVAQSERHRSAMWALREMIPEGEKHWGGSVKHDISIPISALDQFLKASGNAVRSYDLDLELSVYGHVGDGNLHYNVLVPRGADRLAFTALIEEHLSDRLYDIAASLGGVFSAEHGVGRLKRHLLERYSDPGRLDVMRRIKAAFDPEDRLNSGAVVAPRKAGACPDS
jgi:FAD/FMN-containing dehydrogenase